MNKYSFLGWKTVLETYSNIFVIVALFINISTEAKWFLQASLSQSTASSILGPYSLEPKFFGAQSCLPSRLPDFSLSLTFCLLPSLGWQKDEPIIMPRKMINTFRVLPG